MSKASSKDFGPNECCILILPNGERWRLSSLKIEWGIEVAETQRRGVAMQYTGEMTITTKGVREP